MNCIDVPINTTCRVLVSHGQCSAVCGSAAGMKSAFKLAWHWADDAVHGAPGRGACWVCPNTYCPKDPSSEIRCHSLGFPTRRGRRRELRGATPTAPLPLIEGRPTRAAARAPAPPNGLGTGPTDGLHT